MKMNGSTADQV